MFALMSHNEVHDDVIYYTKTQQDLSASYSYITENTTKHEGLSVKT